MNSYSFTEHPFIGLLDTVRSVIPGIEKVVTVFYNKSSNAIEGILSEKKNGNYKTSDLDINNIYEPIQNFRKEKIPYVWYNKESIPFEISNPPNSHIINLFTELKNIVLLIRIHNEDDKLNDLVFLYFNENPSNFGVSKNDAPLTTESKSIIAYLISNTIRVLINSQRNNKKLLLFNNKRTKFIINETERIKHELQRAKENYGVSLVKLCRQYFKEHSVKHNKKYTLSYGATEKIKNYSGDLSNLETIIEETILYVENLYLDEQDEIAILEWHINFDTDTGLGVKQDKMTEKETSVNKYTKTISLLDKLEQAALVVKINNLKPTGTNVGKACPVPISAPAISDALYNHKSKINSLLEMYPEKWETLRNEFRPLMNIIKKGLDEE